MPNKKSAHHKPETPEPILLPYPTPSPQAVRYMWVGVIAFIAVIAFIWFWSLKQQITKMIVGKPLDTYLINQTQANWNQAFANQQSNLKQTAAVKEDLKNIINNLTAKNAASSTIINTSTVKQ